MLFSRLRNRMIAKLATRYSWVANKLVQSAACTMNSDGFFFGPVPWSPLRKSLCNSRVALVTTAGLHHTEQIPFDMEDPNGDPTFREISVDGRGLMITHDYYDHTDADRDLNIVFPLERLKELAEEGIVGEVAPKHYSFMGHITGPHVKVLIEQTAPEVADRLNAHGVDVVLLTPG